MYTFLIMAGTRDIARSSRTFATHEEAEAQGKKVLAEYQRHNLVNLKLKIVEVP